MVYEDYEKAVQGLTAENAPVIMENMLASIKEDLSERDALKTSLAESETKVRDLQDTNIKLFLSRTSGNPVKEEEPELSGEEYISKLLKDKGVI